MVLDIKTYDMIREELRLFVKKNESYSLSELSEIYSISTTAKNSCSILAEHMFSNSGIDDFLKNISGISPRLKTIRTDIFGRLKESISLPTFKYCDIVKEEWENCQLREYFLKNIFIFIVFQQKNKNLYLRNAVLWKMPEETLEDEVKRVWNIMQELLKRGQIVKYIAPGDRYFTYFPASSESFCIHVRPHAQSKKDTYPLPVPDRLTGLNAYPKHSFWLNSSYVSKIIAHSK